MGKAMAQMAVVFAELSRDFIRSRTREALAVRRDHGVVLGRPRSTPDDVVARVVRERTEGKTAYAIAGDLNKDAVPTAQGRSSTTRTRTSPHSTVPNQKKLHLCELKTTRRRTTLSAPGAGLLGCQEGRPRSVDREGAESHGNGHIVGVRS